MEKQKAWQHSFTKPKDSSLCDLEIWIEFEGKRKSAIVRNFLYSKNNFKNEDENIEISRFDKDLIMWRYSQ